MSKGRLTLWLAISASLVTGSPASAQQSRPERGWAQGTGLIALGRSTPVEQAGNIADRLLIQETFARWGIAWDENRPDLIEDLFVPDGRFRVVKASNKAIVDVTGRERIKANVAYGLTQQHEQRRHLITNVVIEDLTGRTARAIAYSIVIAHDEVPRVDGTVVYAAQLRREDDGVWRFASFTVGMDAYGGEPPAPLPAGR